MAYSRRRQVWILVGLLVIFGVMFVMRGPARALNQSADLAHLYAASVLWLEGGSPYNGDQCVEAMQQAGYGHPEHVANGSFYPPPSIAALSPLGLMRWDTARLAWLALNLIACAAVIWVIAHWLKLESNLERWLLAALLVLAWGATSTTVSLGQLALVAAACSFVGLVLLDRDKSWMGGLLIALGCLIKPQLGIGFLVLIVLRRQWLAVSVALALIVLVSALGVGRVMLVAPNWASQLAANISQDQAPGEVLDASLQGPFRYQMIDLRPLLHLIIQDRWVNLSALLFVSLLSAAALWKLLSAGLREHALLTVSGVGLLVLLPVYHRYYDAVLLLPLLTLVVNSLARDRRDLLMLVIGLAMLPMLLPLPSILVVLQQKGVVPETLHASWPWQHIVLQVQSWCLLISAIALVAWTYRRGTRLAEPA